MKAKILGVIVATLSIISCKTTLPNSNLASEEPRNESKAEYEAYLKDLERRYDAPETDASEKEFVSRAHSFLYRMQAYSKPSLFLIDGGIGAVDAGAASRRGGEFEISFSENYYGEYLKVVEFAKSLVPNEFVFDCRGLPNVLESTRCIFEKYPYWHFEVSGQSQDAKYRFLIIDSALFVYFIVTKDYRAVHPRAYPVIEKYVKNEQYNRPMYADVIRGGGYLNVDALIADYAAGKVESKRVTFRGNPFGIKTKLVK